MNRENIIQQLAAFVARISYEDLSAEAKRQIKVRVLDWLGCAIGAIRYEPMRSLRNQIEEFGGKPLVTMIGGGKTSPDRAAFYNGALTQYLGFNDSFLSGKRRCHPSNNLPAILAASEYVGASGMEFLTALAVAYQVHCRLCEVTSEEVWRFGRSTHGSYAVTAGVAKALKLKQEQTANAIAAAATATSRLEIADVCALPQCQAVYYPESAFFLAQSAFHAMSSISDTSEAIGSSSAWLKSSVSGLDIDWSKENLDAVCHTAIKKFNAEGHAQSALEAILYLRERQPAPRHWIERIELDTFDVAFDLLSNDGWGNEYRVSTKAEAYRSLPYLLAVALLDGEVGPSQYEPERILREDVQSLMRKVKVRENGDFSRRFPEELPARVQIILRDGKILCREKRDYEGYVTRPFTWQSAVDKFRDLTVRQIGYHPGQRIIETVLDIENAEVRELTELLAGTVMIPKEQTEEKVFYLQNYKLAA
jgi:2-methylcitrate dehydratase